MSMMTFPRGFSRHGGMGKNGKNSGIGMDGRDEMVEDYEAVNWTYWADDGAIDELSSPYPG